MAAELRYPAVVTAAKLSPNIANLNCGKFPFVTGIGTGN
jgi:hypothetical protein